MLNGVESACRAIPFIMIITIVLDPCLSNPCDTNADCERENVLSENFTCSCRDPYTIGDGFNCSSKYNHLLFLNINKTDFISTRSLHN